MMTELKQFLSTKHRGITGLGNSAMAFVYVAVIIAVGAIILAQFQSTVITPTVSNSTAANNTINSFISALSTFGTWAPLLALIIVAALIIGYLMSAFGGGRRR